MTKEFIESKQERSDEIQIMFLVSKRIQGGISARRWLAGSGSGFHEHLQPLMAKIKECVPRAFDLDYAPEWVPYVGDYLVSDRWNSGVKDLQVILGLLQMHSRVEKFRDTFCPLLKDVWDGTSGVCSAKAGMLLNHLRHGGCFVRPTVKDGVVHFKPYFKRQKFPV